MHVSRVNLLDSIDCPYHAGAQFGGGASCGTATGRQQDPGYLHPSNFYDWDRT
jgi:hypothetical protein